MIGGWKRIAAMGMLGVACGGGLPYRAASASAGGFAEPEDTGLQSKDVVVAADKMCRDLLADPNLNASHTRMDHRRRRHAG